MVIGSNKSDDFSPVVGWQLLNIAHSFSHRSSEGDVNYTYEIYVSDQRLEVSRILRQTVVEVVVRAQDRLALLFDNGDELIIHDHPQIRSWWFMPVHDPMYPDKALGWQLSDGDID